MTAGTWSEHAVLAAILDWHAEVGRPPLSYEWRSAREVGGLATTEGMRRWEAGHPRWPSKTTVLRYFGSWSEALETAGLPVRRLLFDAPFEERVLAARQLAADGLDPKAIAEEIGVRPRTVSDYLRAGTCEGCGAPILRPASGLCRHCAHVRSSWSQAQIIEAIRLWSREEGRPPTKESWSPANPRWKDEFPLWPSPTMVALAFGSWNDGLIAAGFGPRGRTWSASEIIAALRAWTSAHGGKPPAYGDWRRASADHPGVTVVAARFGSWRDALIAAGLAPRHRRWTREEIISAIQRWSDSHGGKAPDHSVLGTCGLPSRSVVGRRFGSIEKATRAAGLVARRRRRTAEDVEHGQPPSPA